MQHAAREMFLSRGYAATTIAAVAATAGVSPETIYKSFGGKPGLVRAIADQALGGAGGLAAWARFYLEPVQENAGTVDEAVRRQVIAGQGAKA